VIFLEETFDTDDILCVDSHHLRDFGQLCKVEGDVDDYSKARHREVDVLHLCSRRTQLTPIKKCGTKPRTVPNEVALVPFCKHEQVI
jgi:hypothetical protein